METEEIWTDKTAHFQQHIHSRNNAVAFTSLGAKLDRQITLVVCTNSNLGAPHHSTGSFLRPTKDHDWHKSIFTIQWRNNYNSANGPILISTLTPKNLGTDSVKKVHLMD
jgi:hypothetical protein